MKKNERPIDVARRIVRRAFLSVEGLEGRRLLSETIVTGAVVTPPTVAVFDWNSNHLGVQGDPNGNIMLMPSPATPLIDPSGVPTILGIPLTMPPAPTPAPVPVPEQPGEPPDGYALQTERGAKPPPAGQPGDVYLTPEWIDVGQILAGIAPAVPLMPAGPMGGQIIVPGQPQQAPAPVVPPVQQVPAPVAPPQGAPGPVAPAPVAPVNPPAPAQVAPGPQAVVIPPVVAPEPTSPTPVFLFG